MIVLVPFLFNCFWVVLLFSAWDNSNKLAELEREQGSFTEGLNSVLGVSYETRESFVGYLLTGKESYLNRARQNMNETKAAIKRQLELPNLTEEQKAGARELANVLDEQFEQIYNLIREHKGFPDKTLLTDLEVAQKAFDSVLDKNLMRPKKSGEQGGALEKARRESANSQMVVRLTVVLGMLGNLLLALSLILFINKDLSKRLALLMNDAQRLARRQPLAEPVPGDDELFYLDLALHDAASDLQKAFEYRASLMQMVAHDLRSPILSCRISLAILSESELANLTAKGQKQFAAINSNLDRLVNLINGLLLIEQFEDDKLALNLDPENIKEVIDSAVAAVVTLAEAKEIKIQNQADREYLNLDRERIVQVLINYLSNAIKFSPKGSVIEVGTAKVGSTLRVLVKDEGVGVSK